LISPRSHTNEVVTIETFGGSILRTITLFDVAQDFSEEEEKSLTNKVELNASTLENFCNGNERYLGGPPKINSDT
jgi:CHASE1-domain containing sensor protein